MASSPTAAATTNLNDAFAAVSAPLLSFLLPRDLFAVSLIDKYAYAVVTENLFNILYLQQNHNTQRSIETQLSSGLAVTNDTSTVDILYTHSFTSRDEIINCLLDKIKLANVRYIRGRFATAETLQETLSQVGEDLHNPNNWLELDGSWSGTFRSDPNEIWKNATKFSVTCRLGHDGRPIRNATAQYYSQLELLPHRTSLFWLDYNLQMLDRNECSMKSRINIDWGRYIIASKGVVGREWSWKCDGDEEIGFMIKPQQQPTNDNNKIQVDQLEIRLSTRVKSTNISSNPPSLLSAFGFELA